MRILVLGGDGMLGHQLLRTLGLAHEVKVTLRRALADYVACGLFGAANAYDGIDVRAPDVLREVMAQFRPDAVVNAIGLVTHRAGDQDIVSHIEINALFPHRLWSLCREHGTRLVHVSTDAVFSGARGGYHEDDPPDPLDTYGRCKLLGEVAAPGALTLRTAIIGLGLTRGTGLIDWFLRQHYEAKGYRNAFFSGLTAKELSRVIEKLVRGYPGAGGLYHLSAARVSKFDLLSGLRDRLGLSIQIVPEDAPRIDRSLDSTPFRAAFSYSPPSWSEMLDELADDIRTRKS
ncbi:MAG: SDR family oxidoreductase [Alphaproteobacteria bacterium]|nr:SDR family oxidoreductase [Alphaproteobacteria bacterium]